MIQVRYWSNISRAYFSGLADGVEAMAVDVENEIQEWLNEEHPRCTNLYCAWPSERCAENQSREDAERAIRFGLSLREKRS